MNSPTIIPINLDAEFQKFTDEVLTQAALSGEQDSAKGISYSEEHFMNLIFNPTQSLIQEAVFENQKKYLPGSSAAIANAANRERDNVVSAITPKKNKKEIEIELLSKSLKSRGPDFKVRCKRFCLYVMLLANAGIEGYFTFETLTLLSFPLWSAICGALVMAGAVSLGVHSVAGYINRAISLKQRVWRYAQVLIPGAVVFGLLGVFRASVYNMQNRYRNLIADQVTQNTEEITFWGIGLLCFMLFTVVLFLSVHFSISDEERAKERAYADDLKELKRKKKEKADYVAQINQTCSEAQAQTSEAMKIFEYAKNREAELVTLGNQILDTYIKNFTLFNMSACPPIFSRRPKLQLTLFFNHKSEIS